MLSKKVKARRAINRVIRNNMPWKFCMETYRDHQITLAELQLRSSKHIEDPNVRVAEVRKLLDHIAKLKASMETITRAEFVKELTPISRLGTLTSSGFKQWMRLILEP